MLLYRLIFFGFLISFSFFLMIDSCSNYLLLFLQYHCVPQVPAVSEFIGAVFRYAQDRLGPENEGATMTIIGPTPSSGTLKNFPSSGGGAHVGHGGRGGGGIGSGHGGSGQAGGYSPARPGAPLPPGATPYGRGSGLGAKPNVHVVQDKVKTLETFMAASAPDDAKASLWVPDEHAIASNLAKRRHIVLEGISITEESKACLVSTIDDVIGMGMTFFPFFFFFIFHFVLREGVMVI